MLATGVVEVKAVSQLLDYGALGVLLILLILAVVTLWKSSNRFASVVEKNAVSADGLQASNRELVGSIQVQTKTLELLCKSVDGNLVRCDAKHDHTMRILADALTRGERRDSREDKREEKAAHEH